MIESIPAALTSLSAASNIISGLLKLRDFSQYAATFTELQSHIIQANSHIISEQQSHSILTAKVQELEQECMRLKNWAEDEKQAYSRKQIATGVFAYVENNFVGKFENAHKLCCNFFTKAIPSTLQQEYKVTDGWHYFLACQNRCPSLVFRRYSDPT